MTDQHLSEWDAMRLADVMSIAESACCIVGVKTSSLGTNRATQPYLQEVFFEGEFWPNASQSVYLQVVESLKNSVQGGKLKAVTVNYVNLSSPHVADSPTATSAGSPGQVDGWTTLIDIDVLKDWLVSRNLRPAFFFPAKDIREPDYLDPIHPRYSAKLAAAVRVWLAMEDENLRRGKSTLGALTAWLESRYLEYGLTHRQYSQQHGYKIGDRNDGAIREVAKVANWQVEGGAPKTPA